MRHQNPEIAIISAELTCLTGEFESLQVQNEYRSHKLATTLGEMGFGFKHVQGMYKGSREASFLVVIHGPDELSAILNLGFDFGQESILYADQDRNAKLIYCDGHDTEPLGVLQRVESVEGLDAWTHDPGDDSDWACVK